MLTGLRAILPFHDLKKKRGNGGGLSDGGLENIRASLSSQDTLIGPPPGKLWMFNPTMGEPEMGYYMINFDAVEANFEVYLVLADGTEFLADDGTISPTTVFPQEEPTTMLAYPMKMRIKLLENHQKRVLFAALATEFDLPKE